MEDYSPRPKASQTVAAAKRARPTHETEPIQPLARPARNTVPFGVGALLIILLMIGMASYQLAKTPARPLQLEPTAAATFAPSSLVTPPTIAPAPTTAPEPTIAPTESPVPAEPPPAAPQTGQGLTYVEPAPVIVVDQPAIAPPAAEPATGEKEAPDRTARHRAAVARDLQQEDPAFGQKGP